MDHLSALIFSFTSHKLQQERAHHPQDLGPPYGKATAAVDSFELTVNDVTSLVVSEHYLSFQPQ